MSKIEAPKANHDENHSCAVGSDLFTRDHSETWNVGPITRWKTFREASRLCSGFDWGESVPDKSVFVDTLNRLSQSATQRELSHAGSGFLYRKVMDPPSGAPDPVPAYAAKMAREPARVNRRWRRMAERVVVKIFRKGWDRNWKQTAADWMVAQGKAVGEQGFHSDSFWEGEVGWWYRHVVGGVEPQEFGRNDPWLPEVRTVKVLDEGGGKKRIITIASGYQHVFAPLHNMIYAKLSRQKWLLRGEASETALRGMCYKKGEVFVSGDYESATDNIPSTYSRTLLRLILAQCRYTPTWLRDAAVDSMAGFIDWHGQRILQRTGQMMGNYLSFPLLCLHNFITFLFGLGYDRGSQIASSGLLKINGDDILFRATRDEFESWAAAVEEGGLTLSRGKTLVHCRFASVNSTFFCITKKVRRVPVIRSKTWFYMRENKKNILAGEESVAGRYQRVKTDCRGKRDVCAFFLGVWAREIYKLKGGSVAKTCGPIPVPRHVEGVTSFRHILDSVWVDVLRRPVKKERDYSSFCIGNTRGLPKYWLKLSKGDSFFFRWTGAGKSLSVGLPGLSESAQEEWEILSRARLNSGFGLAFRTLWKMAKKRWLEAGPTGRSRQGDLVQRGLLPEVPTFVTGGVLGDHIVKEGMWFPGKCPGK